MSAIVTVQKLEKFFGDEESRVEVIHQLDFSMEKGTFEAVMGSSGSGKSTFMHLLAGLIPPDRGDIIVDGVSFSGKSDSFITVFRRRKIGLIFQNYNLIPTLTAEENIALPVLLDHRTPDMAHIDSLIESLGIAERRMSLPSKLSGGECQRVAIARALAGDPSIVLADEPTGNLDSPAARGFCEMLQKLNRKTGCTILMVSHDPVVSAYAERVHILRDGKFCDAFETHGDAGLVSDRYLKAMRA